jgi:hypothetical protein
MDKMEILRLAISAAKDGDHALKLAREMAAFVSSEAAPATVTSEPNLPDEISALPLLAPQKLASKPTKGAWRTYSHWTKEEHERAAQMLDNGVSIAEVARVLGRTKASIKAAYRKGLLPCKFYKPNLNYVLSGAKSMAKRGHKITERTQQMILAGNLEKKWGAA